MARMVLAVAAGGLLGGLARHGVAVAVPAGWSTFAVNVAGSFLLALLLSLLLEGRPRGRYLIAFAGTGVLGSFTTFSTWVVEVDRLRADGAAGAAVAHLLGSVVAGLLAALLGLLVGRAMARPGTTR